MEIQNCNLHDSIGKQRQVLTELLVTPLLVAARACNTVWNDRGQMNAVLKPVLNQMQYCKHIYVLDTDGVQISDNVGHDGVLTDYYGLNRSECRFMKDALPCADFLLSGAYISLLERCPTLTAIQIVRAGNGKVIGFIGADFDLRSLPITSGHYSEPDTTSWRQLKGDPSIRGGVFSQTRTESQMDKNIDTVLGVIGELMLNHGLYHISLHFSSNRAMIWMYDDPYRYQVLDIYQLTDPNICLLYPMRKYSDKAILPASKIGSVFADFKKLRYMDDTLYLRSAGINIFNGIVRLTFSCDGSHHIPYSEFLNKEGLFWMKGIACAV